MTPTARRRILKQEFFDRDTLVVARELVGKFLVRRYRGKEIALMITETEAYDGPDDNASHASRGKTERNVPMFGTAGRWYVYLCYGVHEMLNIVTGDEGYPAAVLIRGGERYDGPGKVTKALHVGRILNTKEAVEKTGLWIEDRGVIIPTKAIVALPRIGVAYAGDDWAKRPYRFHLARNWEKDVQ